MVRFPDISNATAGTVANPNTAANSQDKPFPIFVFLRRTNLLIRLLFDCNHRGVSATQTRLFFLKPHTPLKPYSWPKAYIYQVFKSIIVNRKRSPGRSNQRYLTRQTGFEPVRAPLSGFNAFEAMRSTRPVRSPLTRTAASRTLLAKTAFSRPTPTDIRAHHHRHQKTSSFWRQVTRRSAEPAWNLNCFACLAVN